MVSWRINSTLIVKPKKSNKMSKDLNKPQTEPCTIHGVGGSAFLQIGRWVEKMFCKHTSRKELHRCYQERYVKDVCNNCGKIIYEDI